MSIEEARQKLRNHWAKRFSDIDPKWPYWWIDGDGYCLGIIDGCNLAAAIDIIEDNWEKYAHIKSSKAKILDKDLIRKDRRTDEISNREYSRRVYEEAQNKT